MNVMGRMLCEVVYQRVAMGFDDDLLGVIRLDLGCWDADDSSPDGQKRLQVMRRMFLHSWKRLGEELSAKLMKAQPYPGEMFSELPEESIDERGR